MFKRAFSRNCFFFIFKDFFAFSFFFFAVFVRLWIHMLDLLVWGLKALCISLSYNFLSVLQVRWFLLLYFQVHCLVSHLHSAVKHNPQMFKNSDMVFFICMISILFCFRVSVFLLIFPFFSFITGMFSFTSHSYHSHFKVIVNCNIWITLGLVSFFLYWKWITFS